MLDFMMVWMNEENEVRRKEEDDEEDFRCTIFLF